MALFVLEFHTHTLGQGLEVAQRGLEWPRKVIGAGKASYSKAATMGVNYLAPALTFRV